MGLALPALLALDVLVLRQLQAKFSEGGWLALMCALTVVGGGWGALVVVPLYAHQRTRRFATSLAVTLTACALAVFLLKVMVQRQRPYLVVPGVHALVFDPPTDFSFPSGHSAGSFAFATFVTLAILRTPNMRKRRVGLSLFLVFVAIGVALSRCALGVHFPGDIVGGAVLGIAIGLAGVRWHWGRPAASVHPHP